MDNAQIAAMLRSMADEISGGVPAANEAPPGFVFVTPTGAQAGGKTRLWPEPHPEKGETLLGYAGRCMNVIDSTGKPYYQSGRYGPILQGAGRFDGMSMAEALDRITYPHDWFTQAELDKIAALAERDKDHGFSPGG
jgi:hypothetical protein